MSKKLIIIIAAAVVILGGGGTTGFIIMKKKKAAAEAAAAAAAQPKGDKAAHDDEDEESDKGHGDGSALAIMPIKTIVNLQGPTKNAYLKCEINIVFRDPELGKAASSDKPTYESSVVKSMVLSALSQLGLEEASDPEAREALRSELKEKLNEKFGPKPGAKVDKKKPKRPIKDVLVVEWAIAR